ncbi:aminopeptidase [bacterium]|nr:aminopeptidase [bacterium]
MSMTSVLRGDPRLSKLARIITQYSTEIQKSEKVLISGPPIAEPLILALYREVIRCGAHPTIIMEPPERLEIFYQEASEHQLDYVPVERIFIQQNFDVTLKVSADTNLYNLASVDLDKVTRVQLARRELKRYEKENLRWNVCIFPTNAFAQEAGMSLMEFEHLYFSACFANEEDPVSKWREVRARQDTWVKKLEGSKTIHILGEDTDLFMSIENRIICNSWGRVNMPCGEIYTSPVEETVEGSIKFSYPVIFNGKQADDLVLKFKRGKVVEAKTRSGQEVIDSILAIDDGARQIGEIGIGTNFRLNRFTRNMLLDEKMGGTVHIALGDSYSETAGQNRSAIHIDILKNLKGNGQIFFDDLLIQENGEFTPEFLK